MSKSPKKTVEILLSFLSAILMLLCATLPIFSFWNYRLYMIVLLPVSWSVVFAVLKGNTKIQNGICGGVIIVFSCIAAYISGFLPSALICAGIGILIAIIIITQEKIEFLSNKGGVAGLNGTLAVLVFIIQAKNISDYYETYEVARSGMYDIPAHVVGNFLTTAFNEMGMLIVMVCLVISCVAVCLKISHRPNNAVAEESQLEAQNVAAEEISVTVNATPKVAFCRKCGAKLTEDSQFCSRCGTVIVKE